MSDVASVTVRPRLTQAADQVAIRVSGVRPHHGVQVRLTSTDARGQAWASQAQFRADGRGEVDLSKASSLGGAYTGVEPMGLISLMTPDTATSDDVYYWWSDTQSLSFKVQVVSDGHTVGSAVFQRQLSPPSITESKQTLRNEGFVGDFVRPVKADARKPAVLLFGGSEGGMGDTLLANALAAQGYPTLTLAYFGSAGLPPTLSRIPLEYFARALQWLGRQPGVDSQRLYVLGVSRGGEAAELLGVHFPGLVHGVIAGVPSSVVICGLDRESRCAGPAWTLRGEPLPFTEQRDTTHPTDAPDAAIPVERIHGPIFVVCGGADEVWVSCRYAEALKARLNAHHFRHRQEFAVYPKAGHQVGSLLPYEARELLSRTAEETAHSQRAVDDAWLDLLRFLRASS